jgi:hypothetical protein
MGSSSKANTKGVLWVHILGVWHLYFKKMFSDFKRNPDSNFKAQT